MTCCDSTWGGTRTEHCPACCLTFSSATAGDMHRVGKHDVFLGPDRRRCLTVGEMEAKGMALGDDGLWRSPAGEGRWA